MLVVGLVVAYAGGLSMPGSAGAGGSGNVVSPPLDTIQVQFFPDPENIARLHKVRVTMDRGSGGSDPYDTTPGTTDHYDLYVQLKDGSGDGLGDPRAVHDFGGGVDGPAVSADVNFIEYNINIADIESVAFTICGRHESGDGDFQCRTPP